MFSYPGEIVRALARYRDCFDPRTTSLMLVGSAKDPHRDPFGRGFIAGFEERDELKRRLDRLDDRSRSLLVMWHVFGYPVTHIARKLGVSRVHCYRLERRALEMMCERVDEAVS